MKQRFFVKVFLWIALFVLLVVAIWGIFFIWKINQVENKINTSQNKSISFLDTVKNLALPNNQINLKHSQKNRLNILLLGIAGDNNPGKNLTDTIMIASINLKTNQVALLSIPRDLYVNIPDTTFKNKINAVYQFGLSHSPNDMKKAMEPLEKTFNQITSLDTDYWVVMNFNGFQKIVDAIGGINIINKRDIYDSHYPGPHYSYKTFQLKKGFQHLDGSTALEYARMRHDDPEGDFGRAKRQQQILQAIKNKIFSTGTLLNVIAVDKLLNALGDNLKTNIRPNELGDFLALVKKIDTQNINNAVIDAWNPNSLLIVSHIFYGNLRSFILIPRIGSWKETQELAQNIFSLNTLKKHRQEVEQEKATLVIINKSGNQNAFLRIFNLLKKSFGYKNISIVNSQNNNTEEKTVVYDLTNGAKPFTLNEIAKKLPAQVSYNFNDYSEKLSLPAKTDLVIIIGKDLISHYNMKQDSFEEYNKSNY